MSSELEGQFFTSTLTEEERTDWERLKSEGLSIRDFAIRLAGRAMHDADNNVPADPLAEDIDIVDEYAELWSDLQDYGRDEAYFRTLLETCDNARRRHRLDFRPLGHKEYDYAANFRDAADPREVDTHRVRVQRNICKYFRRLVLEWQDGERSTWLMLADAKCFPEVSKTWSIDLMRDTRDREQTLEGAIAAGQMVNATNQLAEVVQNVIEHLTADCEEPPIAQRHALIAEGLEDWAKYGEPLLEAERKCVPPMPQF